MDDTKKKKSISKLLILLIFSILLIACGLFLYFKNINTNSNKTVKKEPIKCVNDNLTYNLDGLVIENVYNGGFDSSVGIGEFEFDLVNKGEETVPGGYVKIVPNCSTESPIYLKYGDLLPGGSQHYLSQYKVEATAHSKKFGLSYLTDEELKRQEELYSE